MTRMDPLRLLIIIVVAFGAGEAAVAQSGSMPPSDAAAAPSFEDAVDLSDFGTLAVWGEGRVRSFDSFASSMMKYVTGPRQFQGQSDAFTYLDLMLRPQRYEDQNVIYVKNKLLRAEIRRALRQSMEQQLGGMSGRIDDQQQSVLLADFERGMDRFMEQGLIAPEMLDDPNVSLTLSRLSTDLIRTAKFVDAVRTAMNVRRPQVLRQNLTLLPPPDGGVDDQWHTLDELVAQGTTEPAFAAIPSELRTRITAAWLAFGESWRNADASGVNAAAADLVELIPRVNSSDEVYPAGTKLYLESLYFRLHNLTWIWLFYALALVPLLLFVVFRWEGARRFGLGLFALAFILHTGALLLRWYVSGRWPNSNMFEAVTTAAWFGGVFAVGFEILGRRTPIRGLIALGSAAASMVALMCAYFLPLSLSAEIGNMMPVLHDVWLYIHTNVIIFSYCLIFMAAISALLYLGFRLWRWLQDGPPGDDYARVGGAGSLIMTAPDGTSYLARAKTNVMQVLDGTTMILLELSFILLWAGIVMGAIWADHSWGRPWGWDPKEVFALNTFIIFALLIHTRLKVRDKGLWTAIIAIIGCAVMLFNWVVINFTIAGLHSYA